MKEQVRVKEGIPPSKQRMVAKINEHCVELDNDEKTLEVVGIEDGTIVYLVLSLRGGIKGELASSEMQNKFENTL